MYLFYVFVIFGLVNANLGASLKNVGIIGGHNIPIKDAPYMASIRLNDTYHWCGGSIIHEQFILTAAHCIIPGINYKVVVGTDKLDRDGEVYEVEKIIPHEKYSNKTNDYDISLFKLKEPLNFSTKVQKISYESGGHKINKGTLLETSGWGYTQANGNVSDELQQVVIPVVPKLPCQFLYGKRLHITPRMICAGGRGKDSCSGDSGGPLTFDKTHQVGVTSFGAGCGTYPGVYTKVSSMQSWINQTITDNL